MDGNRRPDSYQPVSEALAQQLSDADEENPQFLHLPSRISFESLKLS